MTDATPFVFVRKGRNWATLIALLGVWTLALLTWFVFDAATFVVVVLGLFSLPAMWDLYAARDAGTTLTGQDLTWFSGATQVCVPLGDIDHVRLVTRLDLSIRAAVVLTSGRKLRLPAEATPPGAAFEAALSAHDIRHARHHFTFI